MKRRLYIAATVLLTAALVLIALPDPPAASQAEFQSGLSVTLRVTRYVTTPGTELPIQLVLANEGIETITLPLTCDPGIDIRVYGPDGGLVWRLHPTCVEVDAKITLAPGAERAWHAVWTAVNAAGAPVGPGLYSIYGVIHLGPEPAVAGPVVVHVSPHGEGPDKTNTPVPSRHPERTATPAPDHTRLPEHTRTPAHTGEPEHTRAPEHTRTPAHTREPEHPTTATPVPAESGETFAVAEGEHRQVRPDVAGHPEHGDCQNLVVWWDDTGRQIWGRFVEQKWRSEPFLVSGDVSAVGPPKVAYHVGRRVWLVVWADVTDGGKAVVRGRNVRCAATQEGAVFTIGGDIAADDQPAVAVSGENFAVVWRHALEEGYRIMGAQVVGSATHSLLALSDAGDVSEPAIACEGRGDCLAAWTRQQHGDRDVVGRYWFPRELYVGAHTLEIAVTDRIERYPSIAWNGWYDRGAYAVTWTDDNGTRTVVSARTVYPGTGDRLDGYVVNPHSVLISREEWQSDHGDIAALGPGFVVVWSTGETIPSEIHARRVEYSPDTRTISPGATVEVSRRDGRETYPAVPASIDPLSLVVWQIDREADADILGRYVAIPTGGGRVTLVGVVSDGSSTLSPAAPASRLTATSWQVTVLAVESGEFACASATVATIAGARLDESAMRGDLVRVVADPAPGDAPCALLVGGAGTSAVRATVGRLTMPFGLN